MELEELGKVRTETIKKISRELLERHGNKFTADYEKNKQIVDQLVESHTKKMRNRVSGYVTRLKRIEEKKAASAPIGPVEVESPAEER